MAFSCALFLAFLYLALASLDWSHFWWPPVSCSPLPRPLYHRTPQETSCAKELELKRSNGLLKDCLLGHSGSLPGCKLEAQPLPKKVLPSQGLIILNLLWENVDATIFDSWLLEVLLRGVNGNSLRKDKVWGVKYMWNSLHLRGFLWFPKPWLDRTSLVTERTIFDIPMLVFIVFLFRDDCRNFFMKRQVLVSNIVRYTFQVSYFHDFYDFLG